MATDNIFCNEINQYNVQLCGLYRLSNVEFNKIKKIDDYKNKVVKYSESKKRFINESTKLVENNVVIVFSRLLHYEITHEKDIALYTLNEFKELLENLIETDTFKSVPTFFMYYRVLSMYTEWAYANRYRADYYTVSDLTSLYSINEAIRNNDKVYTLLEMREIANSVDRIEAKIALLCMPEGLKSSDILSLKRTQFFTHDNSIIILDDDREFKMSDELYELCYEYNKINTTTCKNRNGKNIIKALNDTDYLFRSIRKSNSSDKKLEACQLSTIIRNELDAINVNIEARLFRTYSMLYDLVIGLTLEQINKKYNTKYAHEMNLYRSKDLYNKMLEKVKNENIENMRLKAE